MPYDSWDHELRIYFDRLIDELSVSPIWQAIQSIPADSNYTTRGGGAAAFGTNYYRHDYNGGTLHNYAVALWQAVITREVPYVTAISSDGTNIPRPPEINAALEVWNKTTDISVHVSHDHAIPDQELYAAVGHQVVFKHPAGEAGLPAGARVDLYYNLVVDGPGTYVMTLTANAQGYWERAPWTIPSSELNTRKRYFVYVNSTKYSDGVWLTVGPPERVSPYIKFTRIGPPPLEEHISPYVKFTRVGLDEHTSPYVKLVSAVTLEHTSPRIQFTRVIGIVERTSPAIEFRKPAAPTATCEELFPNRQVDLWQAIGYGYCIVTRPLYGYIEAIRTALIGIPAAIADAIANIKVEFPDWLGGFQTWLEHLPGAVTGLWEWLTNPGKKFRETVAAWVTGESPSDYQGVVGDLWTAYGQAAQATGDIHLDVLTQFINRSLTIWTVGFQDSLIDLAGQYKDNPARWQAEVLKKAIEFGADAVSLATLLEALTLGQVDAPVALVDMVRKFSGSDDFSKTYLNAAIGESIGISARQLWANEFRKHLPDMQEVINQVVKEVIPVGEFKRVGGLLGFSEEQTQRIWDAHFIPPDREELVTALRRDKISQAAWNRLKILVDLDPRYDRIDAATGEAGAGGFSIWDEMVYENPGIIDIRFMYDAKALDRAGVEKYLTWRGVHPDVLTAMTGYVTTFQSRFFRRRNLTLNARLYKLGKITEAEFYTRAEAALYSHETAEWELKNQALAGEAATDEVERTATRSNIDAWYLEDIIDSSSYRTALDALGYDADFIDKQLAYLDKKKEPPVTPEDRQATLSMWNAWYMEDIATAERYREALTKLRYDADTITRQLALLDARKAPPPPPTEREATRALWDAWYMADIVTAEQYNVGLTALLYAADDIHRQLALLDKRKAPAPPGPEEVREATRAMYDTLYLEDVINADAYRAALTAQKYTPEVITLWLQYLDKRKTPPPPDEKDLTTERDLLQSEAITAFKKHIIDETKLRERLKALDRSDEAIEVLVAVAKADMAIEERDATLAVYSKAYRQGAILRSIYMAELLDAGYTPAAAELIIQTEELSWGTGVEALTAEQTLNAWEQRFLTLEQTTDRLRKAGWTDSDMKIRVSFSVIDMLKAKHLENTEADKLWTDLGVGPETRAKLLEWYGWTPT